MLGPRPLFGAGLDPLRTRDLRAVLDFVETAWALAGACAITPATLDALNRLIPSDEVSYCRLDYVHRRVIEYFDTNGSDGGGDDLFWAIVDDHPLCRHQQAYADFSATRLSDVISRRKLLNSRIYATGFAPSASRPSSKRASPVHESAHEQPPP